MVLYSSNRMSVGNCKINYIREIDITKIKPSRSGAIVYTVYKNKTYFIMAIDTESGNVTDFAGGVRYVKKENVLDGGLRELTEESLGIFGEISIEEIKNFLAVYDEDNLIIFIRLNIDIKSKYEEFKNRLKCIHNPEVNDLRFLDKQAFIALCNGDKVGDNIMYTRIRLLLKEAKTKYEFFKYL